MKFNQEFHVAEDVAKVWAFFEQPGQVAKCIPGVKKAEILDEDNVVIVVTQRLGPMSATFDAKIHITERIHQQRIAFTSTGKAVRGAAGNFRATNSVELMQDGDHTRVVVDGGVAMAGALGSVGQKVIAKQAEKVTAQFTRNLERVLSGEELEESTTRAPQPAPAGAAVAASRAGDSFAASGAASPVGGDPWPKISAALSGISVILGLIILWQL